ncbi:MAG TPA: AmmeMemoRadiSam system protein B [Deltaproteobacteria bacterium]|nr:AmmeMemoRadiSam system protein B [Deltaproteobacteria bacterium]
MTGMIRKSIVAGSWYPDIPDILRDDISRYMEKASAPEIPDKPAVIISPHAGYMFSGGVAGYAYKAVSDHHYKTVVVISPSHRAYFPFVSVWAHGGFETPLGIIEVDEDLCGRLIASSEIFKDDQRAHANEHALEIQLPFLQSALGSFTLCPLIMGRQDFSLCEDLAHALAEQIRNPEEVLMVASSDLSHFHPARKAEIMDSTVARHIEDFDIDGLSRDLEHGEIEACGGGPILVALLYARALGRKNTRVLNYAHSGHITGDNASVVGYLSAAIY